MIKITASYKSYDKTSLLSLFLYTILLLSISGNVSAKDNYSEATALFEKQNYQAALNLFLAEEKNGKSNKSLRYNIAVCYYRLDQWQQANYYFGILHQQYPSDDAVIYSYAITQKKIGHLSQAKDLFLTLAQSSNSFSAAAKIQYQQLSSTPLPSYAIENSNWVNSANITMGSDNNVINPSDISASERSDTFIETLLSSSWTSNQKNDWLIDGLAYFSRYTDVNDYDINLINIGIKKQLPSNYGEWSIGSRVESSQLSGDNYLRSFMINTRFNYERENGNSWNLTYRSKFIHDLNTNYRQLAGKSQLFQSDYTILTNKGWRWRLRYQWTYDNRNDLTTSDEFYSYSAARHAIDSYWLYSKNKSTYTFKLNYRHSNYNDDHIFNDLGIIHRKDNRLTLSMRYAWKLSNNLEFNTEYSYSDNRSSIKQYEYDRTIIMLGISWLN